MRVAPLIITSNDPLANVLLPVPKTLCSAGLEASVPGEKCFPREMQQ